MAAVATRAQLLVCCFFHFCVLSSARSEFLRGAADRRTLSVKLLSNSSHGELLHVRAVGENDTLHYLLCSQGAPALLLVHTNSSSSVVQVNWPDFVARNSSGSLKVEPESSVQYSTAVVFTRLFEYDDVNDTAEAASDFLPPYELQHFTWAPLKLMESRAELCGTPPNSTHGSLCLQLSVFDSEGRSDAWPRLLHTANSSQVGVSLDGMLPRSNSSRFMLELQSVGGASPLGAVHVRQFIDDEYTPSIFKLVQLLGTSSPADPGFVQWKPVAYRKAVPSLEDATPCHHSVPVSQPGAAASSALIRGFYSAPAAVGVNVSFGLAGTPFYNSSTFLSWTLLVGVGPPPVDSFSPMVIGIMGAGLGVPVVFLLLGAVFVCMRRRGGMSGAYQSIN